MKKFSFYILILIILVGLLSPVININAQTSGKCYWHSDRFHTEGELINPPLTEEQCGINYPRAYWIADGSTTPSDPITAYQQCVNRGGNYESCKSLSGAPVNTTTQTTQPKDYKLLAPLPGMEENFPVSSKDNTALGNYLNVMFGIFIGICAVLAVIMIVVGGIEYMTSELVHSKEHGKERITHAILGLILALGAYTLLNTINPDLLKTDLKSLVPVTVVINLQDGVPQPRPAAGQTYPGTKYKFGDLWDDKVGTETILPNWVSGRLPECTIVGQGSGCMSTKGLKLDYLNAVREKCPNAQLFLTGGTEFWHHGGKTGETFHGPNRPTIDLRLDPELNKCLSGGEKLVDMTRYPNSKGPYYYEGNHWHIGQ